MTLSTGWVDNTGQKADAAYLNTLDGLVNNLIPTQTDITASGTTVTLTVASTLTQIVTGTVNQLIVLPTTSVWVGYQQQIINASTGSVTVEASGGGTLWILPPNTAAVFTANAATPTTTAGWSTQYGPVSAASGVYGNLTASGTIFTSGMVVPLVNSLDGIYNTNTSLQSQATAAATSYYVASSNLALPASPIQGLVADAGSVVGTTFRWRVVFAKNAAGTGAFSLIIYRGTNGSTSDTADVTQALTGTQTAVADSMIVDVQLTVTATGSSGSYFWSIAPFSRLATTGFDSIATGVASGSKTGVNLTVSPLTFGLGFNIATGGTMPTITVPQVQAEVLNAA